MKSIFHYKNIVTRLLAFLPKEKYQLFKFIGVPVCGIISFHYFICCFDAKHNLAIKVNIFS